MSYGRIVGAAVLAALFVTPAGAAEVAVSKQVISVSTDAATAEKAFRQLERKLERRLIYIDWTISAGTHQTEVACGKTLEESTKLPDQMLTVPAFGYAHATISVAQGDPKSFPLNEINCQYRVEPAVGYDLRIRGLYYVLKTAIPTANEYTLRPISGDLEDIEDLRRAGAFDDN